MMPGTEERLSQVAFEDVGGNLGGYPFPDSSQMSMVASFTFLVYCNVDIHMYTFCGGNFLMFAEYETDHTSVSTKMSKTHGQTPI